MIEFAEVKILPYCAGRYKLNRYGEILDSLNNVIKTRLVNNKKTIELDWVDGLINYELGAVIALTAFGVKIPTHLWKQVEPIYEDGNVLNTVISNISYRFKNGPIEICDHPGFFYIPYHTEYGISIDGNLLNLNRNKIHSWLAASPCTKKNTKGGYKVTRIVSDCSNLFHIQRHRAIAFAFIRYETNPLKLVVNHQNGIPGNDWIDNLEWTTKAKNNQHAYDTGLMTNSTIKILMKNIFTGVIEKFISIAECQRKIKRSEGFIRNRIFKKSNIRYSDGLVFKLDDDSGWPTLIDEVTSSVKTKSIIARDIFTGTKFIFNNATEAGNATNLTIATILKNANYQMICPVNGFNFRFFSVDIQWPNHSEKHLKIYRLYPKNTTNGVIVRNLEDKELEFFESAELASKVYNLTPGAIKRYCRENKSFNGNTFYFYKLQENLGPPIE